MRTHRHRGHWRLGSGLVTLALIATGCSFFGGSDTDSDSANLLKSLAPGHSLTANGTQLANGASLGRTAPRYHIKASLDPASGRVEGTVWASLPTEPDASQARFRFFAGLPSFEAQPSLGPATVDGQRRDVSRTHSIATVTLPAEPGERVRVKLPFSYTLRQTTDSGGLLSNLGGGMSPAEIGLLSRHENAVNLGHWLPLWIPNDRSHDPKPDGFGDIGNFPPALFSLDLTVPADWQVATGGVRVDAETRAGQRTVHVEGYGLRSLVGSVLRGYTSKQRDVGGTTVQVYGPKSARKELSQVLETAADSLRVLEGAFGPYPWRELDVIAAPLGAGVGGMEWSGAVWIETGVFSGQLPGLGGLGSLGGDDQGQGALFEGLLGDLGKRLQGVRAWTVAHEVGHQWWHIVVGNDSVQGPVVDEPLAQYSACLVMRRTQEGSTDKLCERRISTAYAQMRMFGAPDAPALQHSDEFASSMQYSGVIYGKAPHLYLALEEEYSQEAVVAALREVTAAHAFELLTPAKLRQTLAGALGNSSRIRQLWQHWLRETHGDADIDTDLGSGGTGSGLLDGLVDDLQGGSNGQEDGSGQQELQELLDRLRENLGESGNGQQSGEVFDRLLKELPQRA